ncbi:MAG: glycosidase, partial [Anaerolineae bacterium]|nr:glycosidase [Anaerolineae bacterium]
MGQIERVQPRVRMVGNPLPNIPWQDKPANTHSVLWRYSQNPIIQRDATPTSNSIFNSAAVPFGDKFAGVFRIDDTRRTMNLHRGFSDDGMNWRIDPDPIE